MYFELMRINDIYRYIGKSGTILVDLRTENDYNRGHIPSAINIPYEEGMDLSDYLYGYSRIYLYCQRGSNSMRAAEDLHLENAKVYSLVGGMNVYRGKVVTS